MKSIKEVLMKRDNMTSEEAEALIQEAKNEVNERLESGDMDMDIDAEICQDYFGLEPDYFMELLPI